MIVAIVWGFAACTPQDTLALSLDQAVARVAAVSPMIAASLGAIPAPQGLRAEARWPFPANPTLQFGRIRRRGGGTTSYDQDWAVTQDIELAGQWIWRGRAASALVEAAEARVEDARRRVALEARRAYAVLAVSERRASLSDSAATFAERLSDFARRQFEAGELNRLEWNAAVLEAARARSAAERASAEQAAAAADLARLLALPPHTTPQTTALAPIPELQWNSDSLLLALARARRPDLRASEALQRGADRGATAARLSLFPSLTLSALGGREGGADRLLGVAVGLTVPLFHRQQAVIGAAESERASALAELTATVRAVQADVLAASARFRRARAAERRFATDVLRAATANVTLTERALAEGEVSLTDVLILRATAFGAQLEYLDVLLSAAGAWFDLAAALAAEPAELGALLGPGD